MAEALPLVVSRKDDAAWLGKIIKILDKEGIPGLTTDQLKDQLRLEWEKQSGELEAEISGNEIKRLADERIERARQNIVAGKPPFEPKRLSLCWEWDPDKREFIYRGDRHPKDFIGDLSRIKVTLGDLGGIEGPNPFARFAQSAGEGEPGRRL